MSPGAFAAQPVHHVGYAVADLEAAAAAWAASAGAGPFFELPPMSPDVILHGDEQARYEHRAAFGQWGPIAVELQQVTDARPARVADVLAGRAPRLNHVSYFVADLAAESERLESAGFAKLLFVRGGPVEVAFHEGPGLGHAIELHQASELLDGLFAQIAQASEGWDGSDPLRRLELPGPPGS